MLCEEFISVTKPVVLVMEIKADPILWKIAALLRTIFETY